MKQKSYKILLSAYACEPNRGSEPGVGWNWAVELANLGHEVHVITRANNKQLIDNYKLNNSLPEKLNFYYYDLPKELIYLKKKGLSVNLYYFLWQVGVCKFAKQIYKKIQFDLMHHITFGVFRHPSFLYKFNVPFVFGPVGGGEHTPKNLMRTFSLKDRFTEHFRNFLNSLSFQNPLLKTMYSKSLLILTKTEETHNFIPQKYKNKTINQLEIGINDCLPAKIKSNFEVLKVLYVGRLIYWKGLKLALLSFKQTLEKLNFNAKFTIVGSGKQKSYLKDYVSELGLTEYVIFIDWVNQVELKYYYENSDLLLFTSYHDSSGNVVLEALSYGLPVVTLDCGGPAQVLGIIFKDMIVDTKNDINTIISDLSNRMIALSHKEINLKYAKLANLRANEMLWSNVVRNTYVIIEKKLNEQN